MSETTSFSPDVSVMSTSLPGVLFRGPDIRREIYSPCTRAVSADPTTTTPDARTRYYDTGDYEGRSNGDSTLRSRHFHKGTQSVLWNRTLGKKGE